MCGFVLALTMAVSMAIILYRTELGSCLVYNVYRGSAERWGYRPKHIHGVTIMLDNLGQ